MPKWRWLRGTLLAGASLASAGAGGDPALPSGGELEHPWQAQRDAMVRDQIEARGVSDPRVLAAMGRIPRHRFVPRAVRAAAYRDRPLAIGHRATISQPYIVAVMTELLRPRPGDRILEVGTGSGYQAAVLASLVEHVYSIEIVPELAERAREVLEGEGIRNVTVVTGDGYAGLPAHAPFDGIVVTAAPPEVPEALIEQLAPGARLVLPVGGFDQELRVLTREEGGIRTEKLFGVRFVPLVRGGEAD